MKKLKINIDSLLKNIEKNDLFITVYSLMKDDSIKKMNIYNENLTLLRKEFELDLYRNLLDNEDFNDLLNLSTADERKNALYKYDYDEKIDEVKIIDNFDFNNVDLFIHNQDRISDIKAIISIFSDGENSLYLYRHFFPFNVCKKMKVFQYFDHRNRFEMINDEMFKIDNKTDAFKYNDDWYIWNLNTIEKNYGFKDIVKKEATNALNKIKQLEIVDDYSKFDVHISKLSISKMLNRTKNSPVLNISSEELLRVINSNTELKSRFKFNNDKILVKSKKDVENVLKLLNDDFLISKITNKPYESLAKNELAA